MGICRNVKCKRRENLGFLGTVCPVNHRYPTRNCVRVFDNFGTHKEMEDCDLSEIRWIISPAQLHLHIQVREAALCGV